MNTDAMLYCKKIGIELKEKINRYPLSFTIYPNSDIFEIFDEIYDRLISSGIALYHREKHNYAKEYVKKILFDKEDPKVLSYDDLSFGFNVWLISCGFSIFGFGVEFMLKEIKIGMENFFGFLMILIWANKSRNI